MGLATPRRARFPDLCNTSVVKIASTTHAVDVLSVDSEIACAENSRATAAQAAVSPSARRVAQAIMALGPSSSAALAAHVGSSVAAVNKHLDSLESAGWVSGGERGPFGPAALQSIRRGRGRPARVWALSDTGVENLAQRRSGHDGCALVAATAVAQVRALGGEAAVREISQAYADGLASQWRESGVNDTATLADALTGQGYAAIAVESADGGVQLLQHHCPIADVASASPQFCEAETAAISDALGRNVVRLSTIAAGGVLCTTLVPPNRSIDDVRQSPSTKPNGDAR